MSAFNSTKYYFVILAYLLFLLSCNPKSEEAADLKLSNIPLIPIPLEVNDRSGALILQSSLTIEDNFELGDETIKEFKELLIGPIKGKNSLKIRKNQTLRAEAYHLLIHQNEIIISASNPQGVKNAYYTLEQIKNFAGSMNIPTGTIRDEPRFEYRGMMLDIARHFFNKEEIKTIIDDISTYKINRLHLHLSDDQGWRIEIKSWPKLTEIGGSVEVGSSLEINKKQGGFLTQKDYADIVAYAKKKGIMIVPEIDMPGHTNAALASYPELNCDGLSPELYTGTEVGFSSFCINKEITYEFIADVVKEISSLTPGKYIHIGGDESHSTEHEDYLTFINRVRKIVKDQGKIMMGWDEIAQADVDSLSIIQYWAHPDFANLGAEKGSKILLSPAHKTYIDMKYDSLTQIGYNWANYINLDTAYNWNPDSMIDHQHVDKVIGIEAPLWTETITNVEEAEFMIFPRIAAYAELGWSHPSRKNWKDFRERVVAHKGWWKSQNIYFYDGLPAPQIEK